MMYEVIEQLFVYILFILSIMKDRRQALICTYNLLIFLHPNALQLNLLTNIFVCSMSRFLLFPHGKIRVKSPHDECIDDSIVVNANLYSCYNSCVSGQLTLSIRNLIMLLWIPYTSYPYKMIIYLISLLISPLFLCNFQ